jgi:lipopolysaccharide export system protein LptA
MSRPTDIAAGALALALLVASGTTGARTSDRSKPMDIDSASGVCETGQNAVCTLTGQVLITQGTLRIQAEKAVITQVGGTPSRAKLSGGVALQQEMDDGDHIDARSANVDYDMRNEVIVFTGNVNIAQRRGSLSGERVVYNLKTGQMESGGNGGRVKMRILPKDAQGGDQADGKGAP